MTITRSLCHLAFGLLIGFIGLGAPRIARAQQAAPTIAVAAPGELQELVLRDGTRALGRVEKVEQGRVMFRTEIGATLEVALDQVVSVTVAQGHIVDNAYWPTDSNPTRLFFGPTGRSLKRGQGYIAVYEVFVPFVQYGVTDRLTIGGGTPPIFGGGSVPMWLTPKYQLVARPHTQAAVGLMHFFDLDGASLGIAYGAVTQGDTDSAFTAGVGVTYNSSRDYRPGTGVLMLGGEHRVSRSFKVVSENYFFDGHGLVSGGVRFMGERLSADFALVTPLTSDGFFAFPMVNFVWRYGK
jgi:hypothetical protein